MKVEPLKRFTVLISHYIANKWIRKLIVERISKSPLVIGCLAPAYSRSGSVLSMLRRVSSVKTCLNNSSLHYHNQVGVSWMIRAAAVACMINDCGEIQVNIKVYEYNIHFIKNQIISRQTLGSHPHQLQVSCQQCWWHCDGSDRVMTVWSSCQLPVKL